MSNFVLSFSLSYIIVNEDVVSDWIEIEKNRPNVKCGLESWTGLDSNNFYYN